RERRAGSEGRAPQLRNCFRPRFIAPFPEAKIMKLCLTLLLFTVTAFAAENTRWIDDLGGHVIRDAQGHVTGVNLRATWVSDADLHQLYDLPDLTTLDLSLTHITDQGMN